MQKADNAKSVKQVALPEGSYTVTWKGEKGKAVTELKDAGTYKGTVAWAKDFDDNNYKLPEKAEASFTVDQVKPAHIAYAATTTVGTGSAAKTAGLQTWTGEALEPAFRFFTVGDPAEKADAQEVEIPAGLVKYTYALTTDDGTSVNKAVAEMKDAGTYTVKAEAVETKDSKELAALAKNYDVAEIVKLINGEDNSGRTIRVDGKALAYFELVNPTNSDGSIIIKDGETIVPQVQFRTKEVAGEAVEGVPASAYRVEIKKTNKDYKNEQTISAITQAGYYRIYVYDADPADAWSVGLSSKDVIVAAASADDAPKTVETAKAQKISKVTPTSKTVKGLKSKKTLKKTKTFTLKATGAKTAVTFKKANTKGGSKIKVASNGKVTVKKGLKKGTYKVKVTATAKATAKYKKATKTVTVKIVVKK